MPRQTLSGAGARGETSRPAKRTIGRQHGERLDTRAARAAGGVDPHLATVGTFDRAGDRRGQGPNRAQRRQGRRDKMRATLTAFRLLLAEQREGLAQWQP
jgi:hypothetical protein